MPRNPRLNRLNQLRQDLGVEALLLTTPSNLYYFSGFRTTLYTRFNGVVMAEGDAEPVLVTSYVDEQLAKKEIWGPVWVKDVRIYGPIERQDVFATHIEALRSSLEGLRTLAVDDLPFSVYDELKRAFPKLEVRSFAGEISALRRSKEPSEIEKLCKANAIAVSCMELARDLLGRPAITEAELGAELEFSARRQGADGYGYPILISSGEKIAAPHSPPSRQPVPKDTPFVRVAFAPTYDGYTSSIIRTFVQTPPEALMQTFERAFFHAMEAVAETLRPGRTVQDILKAVARSYEQSGVRDFWGGDMGYSLGVTVHEPPRIGGTDATQLEAGMVLAIMPGLRKPGTATFHHSDIYVVRETGGELISPGLQEAVVYGRA